MSQEILSYEEFSKLPIEEQRTLLIDLREKFQTGIIKEHWGIPTNQFYDLIKKLNIPRIPKSAQFQKNIKSPEGYIANQNKQSSTSKISQSYSDNNILNQRVEVANLKEVFLKLGDRIKVLRKEKKLSQEKLGEIAELHTNYIGQVERGEKNLTLDSLVKIAKGLGLSLEQLFNPSIPIKGSHKITPVPELEKDEQISAEVHETAQKILHGFPELTSQQVLHLSGSFEGQKLLRKMANMLTLIEDTSKYKVSISIVESFE